MTGEARSWAIPDGWMPSGATGDVSGHEAVCVLNLRGADAQLRLTLFFEDRPEIVIDGLRCAARRTRHFRLDRPDELNGAEVPFETPYALLVESDRPVVVQHTRVDTRLGGLALMTAMAVAVTTPGTATNGDAATGAGQETP